MLYFIVLKQKQKSYEICFQNQQEWVNDSVCALGVLNAVAIQRLTLGWKAKVEWKKWYFTSKAVLSAPKKMAE